MSRPEAATTVERCDIDGGRRGVANDCPIARALARTHGGDWSVCSAGAFGRGGRLNHGYGVAFAVEGDVAAILDWYDLEGEMNPVTILFRPIAGYGGAGR